MRQHTRRLAVMAALLLMAPLPGAPAARAAPPAPLRLPNIQVSRDRYAAHAEPGIAVNPRDPRNLLGAAQLFPAPHNFNGGRLAGTFASFDGGATWHDNGPLPLPSGYSNGSDVSVAFAANEADLCLTICPTRANEADLCLTICPTRANGLGFVVVRVDNGPNHTGIFVWRTADGGRHFLPPVALYAGSDPSINVDHPSIAAAPTRGSYAGALYVAWSTTASQRGGIAFSRSVDDGRHFDTPRIITGPAQRSDAAPVITAGPGGLVSVVYADAGPAGAGDEGAAGLQRVQVKVVSSTDGGRHFGAPHEVGPAMIGAIAARPMPIFGLPAATTDPRDGTLYVSFTRALPGTQQPDIVLMRSHDGGRTWTSLQVTNASLAAQTDHLQPQLVTSSDGIIAISYFTLAHGRVDLYLAQSHDHGASFQPAVRVTSRSWDPTLGLSIGSGQFWVGDYQGLAAGPNTIYPFWNDARTGRLEILTAAVPA